MGSAGDRASGNYGVAFGFIGSSPVETSNERLRSPYTDKTEFWGTAESGASTWNNYAYTSQRRVAFGFSGITLTT